MHVVITIFWQAQRSQSVGRDMIYGRTIDDNDDDEAYTKHDLSWPTARQAPDDDDE